MRLTTFSLEIIPNFRKGIALDLQLEISTSDL